MANTNSIEKEKQRKRLAAQVQEYLKSGKTITKVPPGSVTDDGSALSARRRKWTPE